MNDESTVPDLAMLSAKIGQMVRSNELKIAGKLLATARTQLHQLSEKNHIYLAPYEHVAELRNELMEPGGNDFNERVLLVKLVGEVKELHKMYSQHPSEPLLVADTMVKAAAAIVLVYAQDMVADAPLEL